MGENQVLAASTAQVGCPLPTLALDPSATVTKRMLERQEPVVANLLNQNLNNIEIALVFGNDSNSLRHDQALRCASSLQDCRNFSDTPSMRHNCWRRGRQVDS